MKGSKASFGQSTKQQAATIRQGGKANRGQNGQHKGPAAPKMDKNKGHMHGAMAFVDSREAEAVLRGGDHDPKVQAWKTNMFMNHSVLLHPNRKDDDGNPVRVNVKPGDVLVCLGQGFQHVPTVVEAEAPTGDESPVEEAPAKRGRK